MSAIVGMKEAREVARRYGFTIKNTGEDFRVSLKSNPSEAAAYYASDLQDACDIGIAMSLEHAASLLERLPRPI